MSDANYATRLESRAATRLDHVALRRPAPGSAHDVATWTHACLHERAARAAAVLTDLGVTPGDRVLVRAATSFETVAAYLGVLRAGAVHMPVNPAYTPAEVAAFVDDADPALLLVRPEDVDALTPVAGGRRLITLAGGPDGEFDTLVDAADPAPPVARDGHDPAALLFTSGTTGRAKGAVITHANLTHNGLALCEAWGLTADDVVLHVLPLFHVHGLFVALGCALLAAATTILCPRFDLDTTIANLPRSTVMMGVPTHWTRLLADPRFDREVTAHLRLCTSGSAPLPAPVWRRIAERTGHEIVERYGMTETGIITSNPLDGERVPGTVGFPLTGQEIRIAGPDGTALGPGEVGIVETRGPHVCAGYWRRPEAWAAVTRPDGWFVTGDVGHLDAEGRLTLEGRAGDMIISGGYNVYPTEVELVVDTLPGVVESAVIGLPHPDLGEGVAAVVVTTPDAPDSHVWDELVAERLAPYKRPRAWLGVEALPRNTMGKVQKHELRRRHAEVFTSGA